MNNFSHDELSICVCPFNRSLFLPSEKNIRTGRPIVKVKCKVYIKSTLLIFSSWTHNGTSLSIERGCFSRLRDWRNCKCIFSGTLNANYAMVDVYIYYRRVVVSIHIDTFPPTRIYYCQKLDKETLLNHKFRSSHGKRRNNAFVAWE